MSGNVETEAVYVIVGDTSSPDHSTCRYCGHPISWDDYGYTHDANGFAECGLVVNGGGKGARLIPGRIVRAIRAAGGTFDPVMAVDQAYGGKHAEPVEWGEM